MKKPNLQVIVKKWLRSLRELKAKNIVVVGMENHVVFCRP